MYWYGVSGEVLAETDLSGNNLREFVYFAGLRIARRDNSGAVYYFFVDHLGSARVMTNSTGGIVAEYDYYPFGGDCVISNSVDSRYRFTGLERDSESSLDHTLYRKYASNLGRWLSPDPAGCGVENPQEYNRYPYVINNPTNFIDPLGLQHCPPDDPCPVQPLPAPGPHSSSPSGAARA